MQTRTRAHEAADYLLWLAANENPEDPDFLTPLKLQKLLYFVQGWAIAEWGRPFFRDRMEAWRHGPVVPEVYARYKGRESKPIEEVPSTAKDSLSDAERALVHAVWDAYKSYSGWAVSDLTHGEAPYLESYRPADAQGRCTREITPASMERAFAGRRAAAVARLSAMRAGLSDRAAANTRRLTGRDVL